MVTSIHSHEARRLLDEGAQLIEVLPSAEYDDEHLPGARNIPLKTLGVDNTVGSLDRELPIIAYR